MPCGCKDKTIEQKLSQAELMEAKRIVRWAAWFVTLAEPLSIVRYCSEEDSIGSLPEDGFLMARTRFADGTGDNIGGNGWIVAMETSVGLILQATGENVKPDPVRYPGAKFIKDKLAPSALLHIAVEEAQQWQR